MPRRLTHTKPATRQVLRNTSHEIRVASWLMHDGWQVFLPILDHAHSTDMLISDGPNYFRLQVKTVDASNESHVVENRWKDSDIDFVIVFARNSTWGYILPAFEENKRKLNGDGHVRFNQSRTQFLKAFHKI